MAPSRDGQDPATEAVRATLFKVVSTADLTDPEQAVEWARTALENETLLQSMGAGAHRVVGGASEPRSQGR